MTATILQPVKGVRMGGHTYDSYYSLTLPTGVRLSIPKDVYGTDAVTFLNDQPQLNGPRTFTTNYWLHVRKTYSTRHDLTPNQVKLLLTTDQQRQETRYRTELDRALTLANMPAITPGTEPRPAIPVEV